MNESNKLKEKFIKNWIKNELDRKEKNNELMIWKWFGAFEDDTILVFVSRSEYYEYYKAKLRFSAEQAYNKLYELSAKMSSVTKISNVKTLGYVKKMLQKTL